MRKFALYYGVTRKGEMKILSFGNRGQINAYKEQCKKDLTDDEMCRTYQALVLATDFGLKNSYKPVHPEADRIAKEEQEAAVKADQLAADKALIEGKAAEAKEKKDKADKLKADQDLLEAEEKAAEDRLKAAEAKASAGNKPPSDSDKETKKEAKKKTGK